MLLGHSINPFLISWSFKPRTLKKLEISIGERISKMFSLPVVMIKGNSNFLCKAIISLKLAKTLAL